MVILSKNTLGTITKIGVFMRPRISNGTEWKRFLEITFPFILAFYANNQQPARRDYLETEFSDVSHNRRDCVTSRGEIRAELQWGWWRVP